VELWAPVRNSFFPCRIFFKKGCLIRLFKKNKKKTRLVEKRAQFLSMGVPTDYWKTCITTDKHKDIANEEPQHLLNYNTNASDYLGNVDMCKLPQHLSHYQVAAV
jgi:hypothetical protein